MGQFGRHALTSLVANQKAVGNFMAQDLSKGVLAGIEHLETICIQELPKAP